MLAAALGRELIERAPYRRPPSRVVVVAMRRRVICFGVRRDTYLASVSERRNLPLALRDRLPAFAAGRTAMPSTLARALRNREACSSQAGPGCCCIPGAEREPDAAESGWLCLL